MIDVLHNMTLFPFEFLNEALFSFAKASHLALFLHNVVNRFFTALSVLSQKRLSQCKAGEISDGGNLKKENFLTEKKKERKSTCLRPPLQFQSICYQISSEPAEAPNKITFTISRQSHPFLVYQETHKPRSWN